MTGGGGDDGGVVGTTVGVATALDELKTRGSAVLIVGAVPESIYTRLSARMLGAGTDRRRLIVEQRRPSESRLDPVERWTPEWTRVFRCRITPRRSTAADAADAQEARRTAVRSPGSGSVATPDLPDGDGYGNVAETVDGSIADLGTAVGGAIERFDDVAGGLDPAELRVAFDCVLSLLSEYSRQTVFRFLHLLVHQIRSVRGIGHVRLSRPLDSEITRLLAPLFDATVELGLEGEEPVHRWHFRDADVSSEWLPIETTT